MKNPEFYPEISEWSVGITQLKTTFPVFLQSENFKHDVRLYVNGDFCNVDEAVAYAQGIADKLNKYLD